MSDKILSEAAKVDLLVAETARQKQWIADLQSGMYVNCVYCGHRYGPGETTPVSMADALKTHIEQCPEHPLSHAKARIRELESDLAEAKKLVVADGVANMDLKHEGALIDACNGLGAKVLAEAIQTVEHIVEELEALGAVEEKPTATVQRLRELVVREAIAWYHSTRTNGLASAVAQLKIEQERQKQEKAGA